MKIYKQLIQVIETLATSSKWTGNYDYGTYRKFIYVPKNCKRYTSLSIPTIDDEPDLTSVWIGRILTQEYILLEVHFYPSNKNWSQFSAWLMAMVNNPESLIND